MSDRLPGPGRWGAGPGLEVDVPVPDAADDHADVGDPVPPSENDGARAAGPGLVDRDVLPPPDRAEAAVTPPPVADRPLALHTLAELLANPAALRPPVAVVPRCAWRARVALVVGREKLGGKSTFLTAGAANLTRGGEFLSERVPAGSVLWVTADHEHASEIVQRALRFGADRDAQACALTARLKKVTTGQDSCILELEQLPADPADTAAAAMRGRIRARFTDLHAEREQLDAQLAALAAAPTRPCSTSSP